MADMEGAEEEEYYQRNRPQIKLSEDVKLIMYGIIVMCVIIVLIIWLA